MRTTVDIHEELLRTAKKRAAEETITLREIIERALRQYFAEPMAQKPFELLLKPHSRGVIQPGVVLEDRDVLFDLMDGHR
jgi:Bacterial antitoxin of type II TA system, VapB